jgi:putative PIN family toxin of toxin-antitoxin system
LISAVLDTNTLVSGLGWGRSAPARIVDAALEGRFLMVASLALLAELDRVLRYPRLAPVFANPDAIVSRLAEVAVVVAPRRTLRVLADDADNRVLEVAVEAAADFIVTGDRAFLGLDQYEGVEVVAPRAFIDRMRSLPDRG